MPDIYVAPKEGKPEKKKGKKPAKRALAEKEVKTEKQKRTWSPLAAFVAYPPDIRFETQEREERIVLLLRRHWITNLPWIFSVILLIFAPLFFRFLPILEPLPFRYQAITIIGWYLLTLAFVLENFLSWYFNVDVITDERIVDIDFYSLIYKEISHCKIDQIQDVTFKMGGIVRTLFNYGDVLIQTAAEVPVFDFESVPKPALVVQKLNELILEEEQEKLEGRAK